MGSALSDALNLLWAKFLPQMEERIGVMEAANHALANGSLTPGEQASAAAAAHKLAGVLGTFGLSAGTDLAREAENTYAAGQLSQAETRERLASIVDRLQQMIRSRGTA